MFIDYSRLVTTLKRHEGFRSKPYKDTVGKITVGYGRNLDDMGVSKSEAQIMLNEDIRKATSELLGLPEFRRVSSPVRREVLINMCFNLGYPRLMGFVKMWLAIEAKAWEAAAEEMLDSLWAKQVGSRATELAEMMRTGKV